MSKNIIISLIVLVLIGISITYFIGSLLSKPRPSQIGNAPQDFPVENISFKSESGSLIYGWFIAGEANKGGILLMHGVRSNRLQMLNRARFLNQAGYSVLLFDFQAHGESLGENITFGYLESLDAEAGYNYLKSKLNHQSIGVIGVSLGGAAALLGKVSQQADALILESVYPTLEKAVANRLALRLRAIGKYLSPFLTWQTKWRLGFSVDQLKPIEHISQVTGAVFVIAGLEDHHTTAAESQALFSAAKEPKKLWMVESAGHINFDAHQPEKYKATVLKFFNTYLNH